MQLVKLVDQNTKGVMEHCRFVSDARKRTGRATMRPLVVADQSRIYILENSKHLRSIHRHQTEFQRILTCR